MIKKIIIGALVLIVIAAGATAIYQTTIASGGLNIKTTAQNGAGQANSGQASGQGAHGYHGGQSDGAGAVPSESDSAGVSAQAVEPQHTLPAAIPGSLDENEIADLVYMREEEKLAGDVYLALYNVWGVQVFQNIASSEQMHTSSIKALLDAYGISDPAQAQDGVFTNPELQALYNNLVAQGSASLAEALKVGAAIEEIDILDLQEAIGQTDNADLIQVYNNLMRGSESHLKAFANTLLNQAGETYQPQYLSPEAYQAILAAANGQNGQGGQGGQGEQGGQGGNGYHGGQTNP